MLKNEVCFMAKKEFEKKELAFEKTTNLFIVEINGKGIRTWEDFKNIMIKEFKLPMNKDGNVNAYLDWMTDLDWLNSNGYILIIENAKHFMESDNFMKKKVIEDFSKYILPFWEDEVEHVVVGGMKKLFSVYLVD